MREEGRTERGEGEKGVLTSCSSNIAATASGSETWISIIPCTYLIFEESISSCFEEKLCGRYISSLSREEES